MRATHMLLLDPVLGGGFLASCSCGWEGEEMSRESDAVIEWEDHRDDQGVGW